MKKEIKKGKQLYKLLFDIITSPMGLPVEWYYEYAILLFIGEIAYRIAYNSVGLFITKGYIVCKEEARLIHWTLRLFVYAALCVICRVLIAISDLLFNI